MILTQSTSPPTTHKTLVKLINNTIKILVDSNTTETFTNCFGPSDLKNTNNIQVLVDLNTTKTFTNSFGPSDLKSANYLQVLVDSNTTKHIYKYFRTI